MLEANGANVFLFQETFLLSFLHTNVAYMQDEWSKEIAFFLAFKDKVHRSNLLIYVITIAILQN